MSIPTIVLNTDKNTSNISNDKITIRQSERGLVLTAVIKDKDGTNYDLSDKHVQFAENKDGQKIIVDENVQVDSAPGTIHYTLNSNVYSASGEAWFEIINSGNSVIDSTNNFNIVVIEDIQLNVSNDNYISSLNSLMAHIKYVSDTAQGQIDATIKSLSGQINQAISNGQNDIANELSDARTKLQAIQDQENELVSNWTTELNTQKQNFANLESQWQSQSKSISDDYASKKEKIESDAQSQHNSIQDAADQQLKNNQSANDAEIVKIESETKAKLDEVEKAKNDAIAELTAQRDAQLKAAKGAYDKQRNDQQADYNSWKEAQIADFNALVKPLKSELTTDHQDLKDISDQISTTKKEMANLSSQLDSIGLTKFVTGNQFKEAMAKKASGLKVRGLRGDYVMAVDTTTSNIDGTPAGNSGSGLVDSTVLAGVMQTISDAILGKNHYTKVEVDNLLKGVKDQLTPLIEQKADTTTLTDRANALAQQIGDLQTENSNLKNVNAQLQQQNDNLHKQVTKLTPVHVSSVDDVAEQNAFFVIVDD